MMLATDKAILFFMEEKRLHQEVTLLSKYS